MGGNRREKSSRKEVEARSGKVLGKKSANGRWRLLVAACVPAALVAGYMLYHGNEWFHRFIDNGAARVAPVWRNVSFVIRRYKEGNPEVSARSPRSDTASGPAPTFRAYPDDGKPPPPAGLHKPAVTGHSRETPAKEAQKRHAVIPRQAPPTAVVVEKGITVKQAQKLARHVFGGRISSSRAPRDSFWYHFVLDRAKKVWPYNVTPLKVDVSNVVLSGPFLKGTPGFVVFFRVEDPSGAQWTSTYVGATLLAGVVDSPGRTLGATAIQAASGTVTRREAVDLQNDGVAELVLEIESQGPGGYLFRDLAIHSFTGKGTVTRWRIRTLEDGPGVPLDTAEFRNVSFTDSDGDGTLEIIIEEGVRRYDLAKDFSRTLREERIVGRRTHRL